MKETKTYKQCELRHPETKRVEVSWIPARFAMVGKHVAVFMRANEPPEQGWVVTEVYPGAWDQDDLENARGSQKRFEWVLGE